MKLIPCSAIDINCLKGALLINENGAEFYCHGIGICLEDFSIWIDLASAETGKHHSSIPIERLSNWSVQFNSHCHTHNAY